jgi:hypothetical protein
VVQGGEGSADEGGQCSVRTMTEQVMLASAVRGTETLDSTGEQRGRPGLGVEQRSGE